MATLFACPINHTHDHPHPHLRTVRLFFQDILHALLQSRQKY